MKPKEENSKPDTSLPGKTNHAEKPCIGKPREGVGDGYPVTGSPPSMTGVNI